MLVVPLSLCEAPRWGRRGPRLGPEALRILSRFEGVIRFRCAAETVRLYSSAARRWLQFGGAPGHIDEPLLLRYLGARRDAVSDAAVAVDVKGLRLFYRVQAELGDAALEELGKIPKVKRPVHRVPRILDEEAIAQILTSLPLDDFAGLRDYTLIRLLLETGLRSGEVAAMEVTDLLPDGMLYVHAVGARGRDRYVPMSEDLRGVLQGYLHARAQRGVGRLRALWVTVYNAPLRGPRAVWDIVSTRIWEACHARAGVADLHRAAVGRAWRGHYPHELRATCCARWLENGLPITAVAQLMGHADVSTTARYLGVDLGPLREAMAHHPRARRREVPSSHDDVPIIEREGV